MPWEVALACNAVQQSHDPATPSHDLPPSSHDLDNGLHDPALFVAYLHQLLGSQDSAVNKEIVKEVFQSDPALLVLALCAVLVEGVDPKKSDCTSVSRYVPSSHAAILTYCIAGVRVSWQSMSAAFSVWWTCV